MNSLILILLSLSLCSTFSFAAEAPDFSSKQVQRGRKTLLQLEPPANHHFNLKAPIALINDGNKKKFIPTSASKSKLEFDLTTIPNGEYTAEAYLCDEGNTYCEKHSLKVKNNSGGIAVSSDSKQQKTAPKDSGHSERGEFGFIENNPEIALEKAKAESKPLLIDFYAIWCAPCNMLNEEVFPSKLFSSISKDFILLKLDADAETSWELKAKYKVTGYPTVVFANPDGKEITKIVGYRNPKDFTQIMALVKSNREIPQSREEWYSDQIASLKDKTTEQREWIEKAIKEFPDSVYAVDWYQALANTYNDAADKAKKTEAYGNAIILAQKFINGTKKIPTTVETSKADLLIGVASIQEELGNKKEALKAWKNAANEYAIKISALPKSLQLKERGYNLERAYCLRKAGLKKEAEKIYKNLQKHFPNESTFYYQHAKMLFDEKDYKGALALTESALSKAYGDNMLTSAELKAKILIADNKARDAKLYLQSVLDKVKLPSNEEIRTHRYVKKMQKILDTIKE